MDLTIIPQIGAFVAAGVAAFIAWRRAPGEAGKLRAETENIEAQTQAQIIDDLTEELARQKKATAQLEAELRAELDQLRQAYAAEKSELEAEISELRSLNIKLQRRIAVLEGDA